MGALQREVECVGGSPALFTLYILDRVKPLPASSCSVLYWWNVLIKISSAECEGFSDAILRVLQVNVTPVSLLSAAYYPVP